MSAETPERVSWPARFRQFGRPELEALIASSEVPKEAADCVRRVIRQLHLWPSERKDVARELLAHFADGLADGRPEAELVRDFGDAQQIATLISKSKRRQRSGRWMMARTLFFLLLALALAYAGLVWRFYSGRPVPTTDYVAILASRMKDVPDSERAFPLYVKACIAVRPFGGKIDDYVREKRNHPTKNIPASFFQETKEVVALFRQAAARPAMGYRVADYVSKTKPTSFSRALSGVCGDDVKGILDLASLASLHARYEASRQQYERALDDISAALNSGKHLQEVPTLLTAMLGLTNHAVIYSAVGDILDTDESIPERALLRLQSMLQDSVGDIRQGLEGEKLLMQDLVQRTYTSDGSGGGHPTPEFFAMMVDGQWNESLQDPKVSLLQRAWRPLASLSAPSREAASEGMRVIDAMIEAPTEETSEKGEARVSEAASRSIGIGNVMYYFKGNVAFANDVEQQRRMLLLATALRRFELQHGKWPAKASELVPAFIAQIPVDRVYGGHLLYRLEDGSPVIYSAGEAADKDGILWPVR